MKKLSNFRTKSCVGLLGILVFVSLSGCTKSSSDNEVVIYTALDLMFSEPILKQFELSTGIKVKIVSDTEAAKTVGLVNKLIEMKRKPEADVFWNNEIVRTIVLKNKGVIDPYVSKNAAEIPASFRDKDETWVGFAARARVILYNTNLVDKKDAPTSIFDLAKPKWRGKVVIGNPIFGSTSTHVAALFVVLGSEKTMKFLNELKANDVRVAPGNAMARNLVMDGEVAICLTDTDDANGAFLKNKPIEMVYPDQDSFGTLVFPNTISLVKGAPHSDNAKKLIDYLSSVEVETQLASSKSAQIPLRSGVKPYSERFDLKTIKAMEVEWGKVAEMLEQSNKFVQEVFLR
ncbi:MAG: extracellular solute-binding protein [Planctomycetes bacterium]|nr:extracellular solute-binding protein [Planctomycetota bacterium]